jgi:DNA-binding SARP family transcriptional activator
VDPCARGMADHHGTVLHLFGGPYLTVEGPRHEIPEGARRLVAFVALHHRRVERRRTAGTLWPDVTEERASGNLRSALWRLRSVAPGLLAVDASSLRLGEDVAVDAHLFTAWSARLLDGTATDDDLVVTSLWLEGLDLLPGWFDDWALIEQERLRQRTLHALETLSIRLGERGRFADAVDAALLAVDADPLRESAQRALITVHLAEGNVAEARRAYSRYHRLVQSELGVRPSAAIRDLVAPDDVHDALLHRTAAG